jgi:hypothetical protein
MTENDSPLFEIARVLVRLDRVACFIVKRITESSVSSPGEVPMLRSQEDGFSGLVFDL